MSRLLLIRHAQASFHGEDYDRLSERGEQQARALGAAWAEAEETFDRVYIGPLRRHRQTAEGAAAAVRAASRAWPAPQRLDAFDEHRGPEVTEHVLKNERADDPALRRLAAQVEAQANGHAADRTHAYMKLYRHVMERWARGELDGATPPGENWDGFRERVAGGLAKVRQEAGRGETVAVFTSGGVVAAAVGAALDLAGEAVLDLSFAVRNAAVTEFLFDADRFSLNTFNTLPYATEAAAITHV